MNGAYIQIIEGKAAIRMRPRARRVPPECRWLQHGFDPWPLRRLYPVVG